MTLKIASSDLRSTSFGMRKCWVCVLMNAVKSYLCERIRLELHRSYFINQDRTHVRNVTFNLLNIQNELGDQIRSFLCSIL